MGITNIKGGIVSQNQEAFPGDIGLLPAALETARTSAMNRIGVFAFSKSF